MHVDRTRSYSDRVRGLEHGLQAMYDYKCRDHNPVQLRDPHGSGPYIQIINRVLSSTYLSVARRNSRIRFSFPLGS